MKPKRKRIVKDDNTLPAPLAVSTFVCVYETSTQTVFIDKKTGIIYEHGLFGVSILSILDHPEKLEISFQNPLSPATMKLVEEYFARPGIHQLMRRDYDLREVERVMGG